MFTLVASHIDPFEAQIAGGLLQLEGVDAHVGDEQLALANRECRLALGGTRLRMPSEHAERACAVLRAMQAGEYALDDDGTSDPRRRCPTAEPRRAA